MALMTDAVMLNDVKVLVPSGCGSFCDPQVKPVFAAVSTLLLANQARLYINTEAGEHDQWDTVNLTAWATGDAERLIGFDEFVCIVNTTETAIIYSDDRGVTQVEIDQTVVTDWVANAPKCIDAIDMTFIVIGGANGYLWKSTDAARTWETIEAGLATTDDIIRVEIARDNPQVIYAIGDTNAVIKSENGGETWASTVTTPGTASLALWVKDQNHVLIGDNVGGIYETSDGGVTWVAQTAPDDLPAAPYITDIIGCHRTGVAWMTVEHNSGANHVILRNVDGGADGRWYLPANADDLTHEPVAIAASGPNRALAVGGDATPAGMTVLLA